MRKENFIIIFQNSKLCPHDPHLCAQDYAVDEIFYFARYKRLLNQISDVCAQGYPLDWTDQKVITGNLKKDVDDFIVFLKSKKRLITILHQKKFLLPKELNSKKKLKKGKLKQERMALYQHQKMKKPD